MENFHQRSRSAPVVDKPLFYPFQQPLTIQEDNLPDSFNNHSNHPLNIPSFAPPASQPSFHGDKQSFGNKLKKFLSKNNRDPKKNETNKARSVAGYENCNKNTLGNNTINLTENNISKNARMLKNGNATIYGKNKKLTIYNFLNTSFKRKTIPVIKEQKKSVEKEIKSNSLKNIKNKFHSSSKPEIFDEREKINLSKINTSSYNSIIDTVRSINHKKILYTTKYKNDHNNNRAGINTTNYEVDTTTKNNKTTVEKKFNGDNIDGNIDINKTEMILNRTNYEAIDKITKHNQLNKYLNSFNKTSNKNLDMVKTKQHGAMSTHNFIYKSKSQNVILNEGDIKHNSFKNLAELKNKSTFLHSSFENKIERDAEDVYNGRNTRHSRNRKFFKPIDNNDDKHYFNNDMVINIDNMINDNIYNKNNNLNNTNNNLDNENNNYDIITNNTNKKDNATNQNDLLIHNKGGMIPKEIDYRKGKENTVPWYGNLKNETEKYNYLAYEKMYLNSKKNKILNKNNITLNIINDNYRNNKNNNNNKNNSKPPLGPTKARHFIFGKFHHIHHHHHHDRSLHNKTMTSFMLVGSKKNNNNNNENNKYNKNNDNNNNKGNFINKNNKNDYIQIMKNDELNHITKKNSKDNFPIDNKIVNSRSWYDFEGNNYEMKQGGYNRNRIMDKNAIKSLHSTFGCFSISNKDNDMECFNNNVGNVFENKKSMLISKSLHEGKRNFENKKNCDQKKLNNFSFKLMNIETQAIKTSIKNTVHTFNENQETTTPIHSRNQAFSVEDTITKHNIGLTNDTFTETPRNLYNDIKNDTYTYENPLANNTYTQNKTFTPKKLENNTFTHNNFTHNSFTHNSSTHNNTPDIYKTPLNTFQDISWDTLVSTFNLGNVKANNTYHMTGKVYHSIVKAAVKRKMLEDLREERKMKCRRRLFEDDGEKQESNMRESFNEHDNGMSSNTFENVDNFQRNDFNKESSKTNPNLSVSPKKLLSFETSQRFSDHVAEGSDVILNGHSSFDEDQYMSLGVFPLAAKIPDLLKVPNKNNNESFKNNNKKSNNDNNNNNNCEHGCLNGCNDDCINKSYKDLLRKAYSFKNDNVLNTDLRWSQISENYV